MKKLFLIAGLAGLLVACTDTTSDATTTTDTMVTPPMEAAPVVVDTIASTTMKEGVMTMKDGKVMVMTNGAWVELKEAVTTTNGRKVAVNGEVSKGDKKRMLEEGMMIDKDGQMMDKDGKMLDNSGWE